MDKPPVIEVSPSKPSTKSNNALVAIVNDDVVNEEPLNAVMFIN
jgi:hypothetical protein